MGALPIPVRVVAGLVATAVEEARELPRRVAGLPVTAVSRVFAASMRLQQRVTELAIKGDQVLSGWLPAPENPEWARFDDEPAPQAHRNGAREPLGDREDASDPRGDTDGGTGGGPAGVVLGPIGSTPAAQGDGEAEPLPGYDALTIAQLRGRLRTLSVEQMQQLLAWEADHQDRPPFVTMLANRIATVTAQQ